MMALGGVLLATSPSAFAQMKSPAPMKSPMSKMKMKSASSTKLHTTSKQYNDKTYQKPMMKPTP